MPKSNRGSVFVPAAASLLASFLTMSSVAIAQSCENYTVVGSNCSRTVTLGWGAAGQGTTSVLALVTRPAATAPITFQITQVNSSLGSSYSGYFGVTTSSTGAVSGTFTSGQFPAVTLAPGGLSQITISQVCFSSGCGTPGPAAAVSNMFSMQLTITAHSGADLDVTPLPLLTIQFLNGSAVGVQEQEQALDVTSIGNSARTNVNEGAANEGRYYAPTGTAVTEPYTAFSLTNPSATAPLNVLVSLYDFSGNLLAGVRVGPIPPLGASGYLLIGRIAGDALGLLPYDTLLPSGADGIFHGVYGVQGDGPVIFLSQEFYGNSMLNSFIVH